MRVGAPCRAVPPPATLDAPPEEAAATRPQEPAMSRTPATTSRLRLLPGTTVALAATAAIAAFGFSAGATGGPATVAAGPLHLVSEEVGPEVGPEEAPAPEQTCDVAALATGLAEDPDRAAAWAGVRGIAPEEAGGYLVTLSPVALDGDGLFTRFVYQDGAYVPQEAQLPAGTEVLVDETGLPTATCDVGDPLAEPAPEPPVTEPVGEPGPPPEEGPGPVDEPQPEPYPEHQEMGQDTGQDPGTDPGTDPHDPDTSPGTDEPGPVS